MASISFIFGGSDLSNSDTPATISPVGEPLPVNPKTSHTSSISGISTLLTDQFLLPSGVSRVASKICFVPAGELPETTTHPPSALVAVSVGLALPFWALASAECPILASEIKSRADPGSTNSCKAAPIALDSAADEPSPAAEYRPLLMSISKGGPEYWKISFSM